jgi:hypothetical protein
MIIVEGQFLKVNHFLKILISFVDVTKKITMNRFIAIALIVLLSYEVSFAQIVSLYDAKETLSDFLSNEKSFQTDNLTLVYTEKESDELNPVYYIFDINDQGFAVISADERIKPILAYSLNNKFDPDHMPVPVQQLFEKYKAEISNIIENNYPVYSSNNKNIGAVSALLETEWGQSPYYNYYCPGNTPTGCVATATAQVLRYYNHPEKGNGYHSYDHSQYGTLSANFGATYYDWANMPVSLNSSSTYQEKKAVATLMFHIGVALDMNYADGGSNAFPNRVADIVNEYFSYSGTAHYVKRSSYTLSSWINLLKQEPDEGNVVLHTGFCPDPEGGHAFVVDGYDSNDLFHINWGWSGWYDGYFEINNLNPGSTYTFNETQGAVIDFEPVDTYTELMLFGDIELSTQDIAYDDTLFIGADVANYGNLQFFGDFKVSLFDTNNVFIADLDFIEDLAIDAMDYAPTTFYTTNLGVVPGEYLLGIYMRNSGDENWTLVNEDEYTNPITIIVNGTNEQGLISDSEILVNPDPVEESNPVDIEFIVYNNSDSIFEGTIGVWLHELNGDLVEQIVDSVYLIDTYDTESITFHTTISDVMGTFKLFVWYQPVDEDWKMLGSVVYPNFKQIDVVLENAFTLPVDSYENNNQLETAYEITPDWIDNVMIFETIDANIHSAMEDSSDYYSLSLEVGYNYSIYVDVSDNYTNPDEFDNDVVFQTKSSMDMEWSDYYDDIEMDVATIEDISNPETFDIHVNPFYFGMTGSYQLNIIAEREIATESVYVERKTNDLLLYPNPVKNSLRIIALSNQTISYEIIDVYGKAVVTGSTNNGHINTERISTGTYMIRVVEDDEIYFGKFIKM